MSDSTTAPSGKIVVTPQMVDAMLEILVCHGQNQAGLAVFAGVSASTVSGIVKAKSNKAEYRSTTWEGVVGGLKQLMQSSPRRQDVDETRLKQLLQVLNIREPRVSLPGDVFDASWDNYVERGVDSELRARLVSRQSALLGIKGGHRTGHSSLLREFTRKAESAGVVVHSINVNGPLAFNADWGTTEFYQTILGGIGMNTDAVDGFENAGVLGTAMLSHFMKKPPGSLTVVIVDDLQRSIMSYNEEVARKQAELARQLPLIFNRVVQGLESRASLGQVIVVIAGPMPFYFVNPGSAYHQSRLSMQEHTTAFLSNEELKALFINATGHEPIEKQMKSMREVLLGQPYLVHAAISDLRRNKHALPEEPAQFSHHAALRFLAQRLESTYRSLAACDSSLPKDLGALIESVQAKKPGRERDLCIELGVGDFIGGAYRNLPPLEYYYLGKTL